MGEAPTGASRWAAPLAVAGFIAVAFTQAANMILARANAGAIPPFSLAFFRWSIIAAGLLPFVWLELNASRKALLSRGWLVLATGFCGMFICGGPVYIAGITTSAINIALIMALSPIVVLLVSWLSGLERVGPFQVAGVAAALAGALAIVLGAGAGHANEGVLWGDALVVAAMLGWSGYTLLQSRAAPEVSFIGRVCVFAAAGALFSLPFAAVEAWDAPQRVFSWHAAAVYLFAGIVPGLAAYAGFGYLGSRFGSVRSSLVIYLGPVASAILSFALLGEPPHAIHFVGGALILAGVWSSLRK